MLRLRPLPGLARVHASRLEQGSHFAAGKWALAPRRIGHDDSFRAADRLCDDVEMKVALVEEIAVSEGEWLAVDLEPLET